MGGFTIHISSLGKILLQPLSTVIDTRSQDAVDPNTDAYLSSQDHIRCIKLPSATIQDFTQFGFPSILGLIVNRFIIGIAVAFSP